MNKKLCTRCLETKPTTEFHKQARVASGYQSICKVCRKISDASLYIQNKKRRKGNVTAIRKARAAWNAELKNKPCTDCGKRYPHYVMHWDHLPGSRKVAEVSKLVRGGISEDRILEEIAKCELVCSNCHAERTYRRKR